MSGYVDCACGDCFEVAIGGEDDEPALCHACDEAGCQVGGGQCDAPHAYCDGGEDESGSCETCGQPF